MVNQGYPANNEGIQVSIGSGEMLNNATIEGNHVTDIQNTKTQHYGLDLEGASATWQNIFINNNDFSGNASTNFHNVAAIPPANLNQFNNLGDNTNNIVGNFGIGSSTPGILLSVGGSSYLGGNVTATGTLLVLGASTTLQNFTFLNATGTQATTSTFAISSLASQLLSTNSNGSVQGVTITSPFTFQIISSDSTSEMHGH